MLEELLDDIVSENVGRQLHGVGLDLSKDPVLLVAVRILELLLDEARAVLVAAELDDVIVDGLIIRQSIIQHFSTTKHNTLSSQRLVLLFSLKSSNRALRRL